MSRRIVIWSTHFTGLSLHARPHDPPPYPYVCRMVYTYSPIHYTYSPIHMSGRSSLRYAHIQPYPYVRRILWSIHIQPCPYVQRILWSIHLQPCPEDPLKYIHSPTHMSWGSSEVALSICPEDPLGYAHIQPYPFREWLGYHKIMKDLVQTNIHLNKIHTIIHIRHSGSTQTMIVCYVSHRGIRENALASFLVSSWRNEHTFAHISEYLPGERVNKVLCTFLEFEANLSRAFIFLESQFSKHHAPTWPVTCILSTTIVSHLVVLVISFLTGLWKNLHRWHPSS